MSSLYDKEINKSINFLEQHVGGNNDDTQTEFMNQKKIIATNDKKINLGGDGCGDRGSYNLLNSEFIYSNARIIPPTIDLQFKYIKDKNLDNVNDQIATQIDYINIDSEQRLMSNNYVIDFYKKLEPNSLIFVDGSNELTIKVDNTNDNIIEVDNLITLDGIMHIKNVYSNINIQFINTCIYE